ncbi:MAG: ferric reductase-like transmembrane domain-containing protein [Actinomycetota bacterium]
MSEQFWWYVSRSSGIVAWALLSFSVVIGLLMATRAVSRLTTRPWLLDVHRFSSGLAVVFTAIHMVALWADNYVHFAWAELFVPMASEWRPGAVAWGIVAMYLLVAVEVTSLALPRLPRRWWRRVHFASLPLWAMGTYHGLVAGTDRGNDLLRAATLVVISLVAGLTLVLLAAAATHRPSRSRAAAGGRVSGDPADGKVLTAPQER